MTEVDAFTAFGRYFGMVFQVRDDILDVVGTEAELGKPAGQDLAEGIYTLPVLLALADPDGRSRAAARCWASPSGQPERDKARSIVAESGAIGGRRQRGQAVRRPGGLGGESRDRRPSWLAASPTWPTPWSTTCPPTETAHGPPEPAQGCSEALSGPKPAHRQFPAEVGSPALHAPFRPAGRACQPGVVAVAGVVDVVGAVDGGTDVPGDVVGGVELVVGVVVVGVVVVGIVAARPAAAFAAAAFAAAAFAAAAFAAAALAAAAFAASLAAAAALALASLEALAFALASTLFALVALVVFRSA